ncbi:hypothetical protein VPH35_015360 [Triticum aestivum]
MRALAMAQSRRRSSAECRADGGADGRIRSWWEPMESGPHPPRAHRRRRWLQPSRHRRPSGHPPPDQLSPRSPFYPHFYHSPTSHYCSGKFPLELGMNKRTRRRRAWDAAGGVPHSGAAVDHLRGVRRHPPRDLPPGLLTGAGSGSGSPERRA